MAREMRGDPFRLSIERGADGNPVQREEGENSWDGFCEERCPSLRDPITLELFNGAEKEQQAYLLFPSGQTVSEGSAEVSKPCPLSRAPIQNIRRHRLLEAAAAQIHDLYHTACEEAAQAPVLEERNRFLRPIVPALEKKCSLIELSIQDTVLKKTQEIDRQKLKEHTHKISALSLRHTELETEKQTKEQENSALSAEIALLQKEVAAFKKRTVALRDVHTYIEANRKILEKGSIKGIQMDLAAFLPEAVLEEKEASVLPALPLVEPVAVALPVADNEEKDAPLPAPSPAKPVAMRPQEAADTRDEKEDEKENEDDAFIDFLARRIPALLDPISQKPFKNAFTVILPEAYRIAGQSDTASYSEETILHPKLRQFIHRNPKDITKYLATKDPKTNKPTPVLIKEEERAIDHRLRGLVEEVALIFKKYMHAHEQHVQPILEENSYLEETYAQLETKLASFPKKLHTSVSEAQDPLVLKAQVAAQKEENTKLEATLEKTTQEIQALEKKIAALQSTQKTIAQKNAQLKKDAAALQNTHFDYKKKIAPAEERYAYLCAMQTHALEKLFGTLIQTHPAARYLLYLFAYHVPSITILQREQCMKKEGVACLLRHFSEQEISQALAALKKSGLLQISKKGVITTQSLPEQAWAFDYLRSSASHQVQAQQLLYFSALEQQHPDSILLLHTFACLAPNTAVPLIWFKRDAVREALCMLDQETAQTALIFLEAQGLLRSKKKSGVEVLYMDPVVHSATLSYYSFFAALHQEHLKKVICWLHAVIQAKKLPTRQKENKWITRHHPFCAPHLTYLLQQPGVEPPERAQLHYMFALVYGAALQYEKALVYTLQAIKIQEEHDPDTPNALEEYISISICICAAFFIQTSHLPHKKAAIQLMSCFQSTYSRLAHLHQGAPDEKQAATDFRKHYSVLSEIKQQLQQQDGLWTPALAHALAPYHGNDYAYILGILRHLFSPEQVVSTDPFPTIPRAYISQVIHTFWKKETAQGPLLRISTPASDNSSDDAYAVAQYEVIKNPFAALKHTRTIAIPLLTALACLRPQIPVPRDWLIEEGSVCLLEKRRQIRPKKSHPHLPLHRFFAQRESGKKLKERFSSQEKKQKYLLPQKAGNALAGMSEKIALSMRHTRKEKIAYVLSALEKGGYVYVSEGDMLHINQRLQQEILQHITYFEYAHHIHKVGRWLYTLSRSDHDHDQLEEKQEPCGSPLLLHLEYLWNTYGKKQTQTGAKHSPLSERKYYHPCWADICSALGNTYLAAQQYEKARLFLTEAIEIRSAHQKQQRGDFCARLLHPDFLQLAVTYGHLNQLLDQELVLKHAQELSGTVPQHIQTLIALRKVTEKIRKCTTPLSEPTFHLVMEDEEEKYDFLYNENDTNEETEDTSNESGSENVDEEIGYSSSAMVNEAMEEEETKRDIIRDLLAMLEGQKEDVSPRASTSHAAEKSSAQAVLAAPLSHSFLSETAAAAAKAAPQNTKGMKGNRR